MKDKLRLGIIGTRGIPNRYGGFEVFAEEISRRLADRGHHITVFCPHNQIYQEKTLNSVHLTFCYNPEEKIGTAGQFVYDLNCNLESRKHHFDVILHLGYTSDSVWWPIWSGKALHLTNMDGMEWKRLKYSPTIQSFLKRAERWAANRSDLLIADSKGIYEYLTSKYTTPVRYISYGADIPDAFNPKILRDYNVEQYQYDIIVARMEPENNIELAIKTRLQENASIPLLIFSNETGYGDRLKKKYANHPLIRFQKAVYQSGILNSLRFYSRYYLHGHSAGGTNPSLLEAMACRCRIFAHNNYFNRSILGDNARYYSDTQELSDCLDIPWSLEKFAEQTENNLNSIRELHNWDSITNEYESAFYQALEL